MRQFLFLSLFCLAMLALKTIGISGDGTFDPILLASIGFVVLAAYSAAEIVGGFGLPRVTGYIVAGILLGPQILDILSNSVVNDIKMFSTLAIGLIALSAGLEFHLQSLKSVGKTLAITITFKIISLVVFVGGGLFALQYYFNILPIQGTDKQIAMSLIFSALAIGTSPAIALAVISESKSKGRTSDLVLGAAIIKDVVVVLALAVALTVSQTFLTPDSSFDVSVLKSLGLEILLSILAGSLLGGLLIVYLKFVKFEMLLFVAAIILATAEVSRVFHLELLLVFIVAGFIVRNFSKFESELHHPLEKVALPVFIIFFTNAGAALDLSAISKVLLAAFAVVLLRALSYFFSSYFGAKIAKESKTIQKVSWLGYLPQAGVTLGLVGIAANKVSVLSDEIFNLGMGVVAINLLLGPILLKAALKKTGDIKDSLISDASEENEESKNPSSQRPEQQLPPSQSSILEKITEPKAHQQITRILKEIDDELKKFALGKMAKAESYTIKALKEKHGEDLRSEEFAQDFVEANGVLTEKISEVSKLYASINEIIESTPKSISSKRRPENFHPMVGDSNLIKWKKFVLKAASSVSSKERYHRREIRLQIILKKAPSRLFFETAFKGCS